MRNHTAPIVTDALFHCPIRHIALRLAQQQKNGSRPAGDLWAYRFDHVLSFGSKFWGTGPSAICVGNVCHGEELPLVFQPPLAQINGSYSSEEMALSKSMQQYWANFANDADPNGSNGLSSSASSAVGAGNDVTGTANAGGGLLAWPKLEAKNESMIRFMTPGNVVDVASDRNKCALWDSLGYEWVLRHS
jgi:acetylcholinesterase/cholinesterase